MNRNEQKRFYIVRDKLKASIIEYPQAFISIIFIKFELNRDSENKKNTNKESQTHIYTKKESILQNDLVS